MNNNAPEIIVELTRADAEKLRANFEEMMPMALSILMSRKDRKSVEQTEYMRRMMTALEKGLSE